MSNQLAQLQEATIKQQCKALRMPMIAAQFGSLAEQAVRRRRLTSAIWKHCWRPRSKSGNGTRLSGGSKKRICRG